MKNHWYFLLLAFMLASCSSKNDDDNAQLAEMADSFAANYFSYDFSGALRFCTEESAKWLHYAASNVTQEDIDVLKGLEAKADITIGSIYILDDSTAAIEMAVSHFLEMDSIGKAGKMVDEATFSINAVKRNGKWKIRMEGLPRSGK
ncbi:MAG: hypothetical protein PUH24_09220 [Prevotellaceae bacterium]|nr:hypothetical protein [Prevotellaceae bacterium]MDY6130039.1 hypothetical protein [Prevotella sp.]